MPFIVPKNNMHESLCTGEIHIAVKQNLSEVIMEYDIIIIGGGAAGMSAAIYACRGGMKTLIIEKLACGGQLSRLTAKSERRRYCRTYA